MTAPIEFRTPWRKSSYSANEMNCVEVAFGSWRKSSFSANEANCVEVARSAEVVGVRDSKNTAGPMLVLPAATWSRLVGQLH